MSLAYYNDKGLFDLCFSMFHRVLILALFLFAIRAHAADPFVWEAYGYWGSRAANPSATCESYVRQFAGGSDQEAEGVSLIVKPQVSAIGHTGLAIGGIM